MQGINELNLAEIEEVSGGIIPALIGAAVALVLAGGAGGYMVGKDMAVRDNNR